MKYIFKRIFNPDWYHGNNKKKPFFEGWYYKLVTKDRSKSFVVIPGIFLDKDPSKRTSFIQYYDSNTYESKYIEFPTDVFKSEKNEFVIDIGGNRFQSDNIYLDINRNGINLRASLSFRHLKPWPVSLFSPGIMGWYAWVPFMECFHGVLSMDHTIYGKLNINGTEINLDGGKGYIEKDWGTAFPEAWVWQQSNHFSEEGISLSASIAIIPWIRKAFPGFIIGFLWDGKLYKFATYTGARTTYIEIGEKEILWKVEDKRYNLEMHTIRGRETHLTAPTSKGMVRQIKESVSSVVEVKLFRKIKTGVTLIYQGKGYHAGLEVEGDINKLINMVKNA